MAVNKLMASPSWILPLSILAPVVFMWSNNWYMYSLRDFFVSFLILALVCSVVFVVGNFVYSKFESRVSGRLRYFLCFMFCLLFVGVLLIFIELPLRTYFSPIHLRKKLAVVGFIIAMVLCFIAMRRGLKFVNFFLIFWLLLSLGTGFYNIISFSLSGNIVNMNEGEHIELVERPNIYLFILESYHDLNTMRKVYGADTEALQSWVLSRGFSIYENVYSNSSYTLASITDVFGMKLNVVHEVGVLDVTAETRRLIGGGSGNQVFRILKENGYHTIFLAPEPQLYYFYSKGVYLDETNVDFGFSWTSSMRPLCELFLFLHNYCYDDQSKGMVGIVYPKFRNNLSSNVRMVMEEQKDEMPLFIGFKSGAKHTDWPGYAWKQKNEWISSGEYQNAVSKGNEEIFEIVDSIVDKDPTAVIVLIGDHGAWRLRNIWEDAVQQQGQGLANLDVFLKQNNESLDALASDIFGTFLAIRMPGKGDISKGLPMSHVNLFRHIFAALADNTNPDISRAILQRRAPSVSKLSGIELVKDGVVQRPAEP